jgi:hypothetical protein
MRSESGQRFRGRSSTNSPPQQRRAPQNKRLLDSHGPAERIRGSAFQITERYRALAREAERSDDRVSSENYNQHAEHYFRITNLDLDDNLPAASQPVNQAAGKPAGVSTQRRDVEGGCAQP